MNQTEQTSWEKVAKAREYLQLAYNEIIQALFLQIEEKNMAPNQLNNLLESAIDIHFMQDVKLQLFSPKQHEDMKAEMAIKEDK